MNRRLVTRTSDPTLGVNSLLCTGMRRSEQYTATWPNVDLRTTKTILVPCSKDGTARRIQLNSRVLIELERLHARRRRDDDLVFTATGNFWFERAVKLAGIQNFTGTTCDTHSPVVWCNVAWISRPCSGCSGIRIPR
jgi:integrase